MLVPALNLDKSTLATKLPPQHVGLAPENPSSFRNNLDQHLNANAGQEGGVKPSPNHDVENSTTSDNTANNEPECHTAAEVSDDDKESLDVQGEDPVQDPLTEENTNNVNEKTKSGDVSTTLKKLKKNADSEPDILVAAVTLDATQEPDQNVSTSFHLLPTESQVVFDDEAKTATTEEAIDNLNVSLVKTESNDALSSLMDSRGMGQKMTIVWSKDKAAITASVSVGDTQDLGAESGVNRQEHHDVLDLGRRFSLTTNDRVNMHSLLAKEIVENKNTSTGSASVDEGVILDPSVLLSELDNSMNPLDEGMTKTAGHFQTNSSMAGSSNASLFVDTSSRQSEIGKAINAMALSQPTLVAAQHLSPDFVNRLSDQVMWLRHQNINVAELRLHPRDLGSILVRIDSSGDNTSVNFVAGHHTVRNVLDQNMTKLRELFSDAGLNLVNVNVSSDSNPQRERDWSGSGDASTYMKGSPFNSFVRDDAEGQEGSVSVSKQSIHLLDFFA